jgi:hypothetical protein
MWRREVLNGYHFFEYMTLSIVSYYIEIIDKKDINIFSIYGDDTENNFSSFMWSDDG